MGDDCPHCRRERALHDAERQHHTATLQLLDAARAEVATLRKKLDDRLRHKDGVASERIKEHP